MAQIVKRARNNGMRYQVKWRLGGGREAPWQSETFTERRAATKFKADVEAFGHDWPEGWVKGVGYLRPDQQPPCGVHPLLGYGTAYVARLTNVGPDTRSDYQRQIRALVGWLRAIKQVEPTVENLTTNDDKDWILARLKAGASPKTIANYHGLLFAVCRQAVRDGLRPSNPCEGVKLPARDDDTESDEDKVFLTEAEFAMLHRSLKADARDLVLVAVGTGLRWGELTALKVKDLDLDTDVPSLVVRRAWKRNGTGAFAVESYGRRYLGKPKTRQSRRRITLSATVVEALGRASDGKDQDDLVFTAPEGGPLSRHNFYARRWRPALRTAGAQGLAKTPRFHDLRHTHAAWLISAGVPLPVVQSRLGHHSIQITVDVYGGLLFQTHEIADAAVERALRGELIEARPVAVSSRPVAAAEFLDDEHGDAA